MSGIRHLATAGATSVVAALVAVVLIGASAPSTASAQAALPYKAYGSGLKAAQVVEAFKGTTSVGKATVDLSGNWSIDIQPGGTANVANGDKITLKLDDRDVTQSVTFQGGQFPAPPGLALTVAVGGATASQPAPAKTGDAGLGATGASTSMVLLLGVLAVALVAGARTATRVR